MITALVIIGGDIGALAVAVLWYRCLRAWLNWNGPQWPSRFSGQMPAPYHGYVKALEHDVKADVPDYDRKN